MKREGYINPKSPEKLKLLFLVNRMDLVWKWVACNRSQKNLIGRKIFGCTFVVDVRGPITTERTD